MADFTKLMADNAALMAKLNDLASKLDAFLAKPPVDDQPQVDAADAATVQASALIDTITAKIPS